MGWPITPPVEFLVSAPVSRCGELEVRPVFIVLVVHVLFPPVMPGESALAGGLIGSYRGRAYAQVRH